MSKKHFKALAESLRTRKPTTHLLDSTRLLQWKEDIQAVADACGQFNGLFDRNRFLEACGYDFK